MTWITSSYMALGLTVYAYCGKWVSSPALGSAGPTIKIIAYGVAIPGMIASAMICVHGTYSPTHLFHVKIDRGSSETLFTSQNMATYLLAQTT